MNIRLPESKFEILDEGKYNFTVSKVDVNTNDARITLVFKTDDNKVISESYNVRNEKALNAFAYVARKILDDMSIIDLDTTMLEGKKFIGTVIHDKVELEDGSTKTYAHVRDITARPGLEEVITGDNDTLDDIF